MSRSSKSGEAKRVSPTKKKSKKAGTGSEDPSEDALTSDQKNIYLLRRLEAQQHQLILEANKSSEAQTGVHELREKCLNLQTLLEAEKRDKLAIASDMTKLYKALKEEKAEQIKALLQQIDSLDTQLSTSFVVD